MGFELSDLDVIIVGAGAAGLGAALECAARGLSHRVLEASHRVGGRAHTEYIGPLAEPFDLGCHWLHSGSMNPLAGHAAARGYAYDTSGWGRLRILGRGLDTEDSSDWDGFDAAARAAIDRAAGSATDTPVIDAVPRHDFWTPSWDYLFSVHSSVDPDQASVKDVVTHRDTGEDWPVKDGLGALIRDMFADIPVSLNTSVREIDWSGGGVRVETSRGAARGRAAIVTVSTGVLGAGDIRFRPALPDRTTEAIHMLPLGGHNRIALVFDGRVFGPDPPAHVAVLPKNEEDVQMTVRLNPFGYAYAVGVTGGRHSDWLERAGVDASVDLVLEKLIGAYGSDIAKALVGSRVSAWRADPFIRGAYSAARPGHADARWTLREPVGDKVFFAGEATHPSFQATCHGAFLSGARAVRKVLEGDLG